MITTQEVTSYCDYYRLPGNYFLRARTANGVIAYVNLELFSLDGKRIAEGAANISVRPINGFTWAQNPMDSGFVVLWGSDSGIYATVMDKGLNPVVSNRLVSTYTGHVRNPTAVFRNDTLFVVWEDYRNGAPDIYGAAVSKDKLSSLIPIDDDRARERSLLLRRRELLAGYLRQ